MTTPFQEPPAFQPHCPFLLAAFPTFLPIPPPHQPPAFPLSLPPPTPLSAIGYPGCPALSP